ncbi:cobalamin B12-binding domain-containing protein [Allokutzneria albata]|uniref:Methanogenic corrinoid protein MtbC1 n=1 Tax=Allokutzneria albata TaxID=211114 RepID=A0A1G9VL59_ALLAB|nr:cobalamin B12-binding domain-containing protein [Allokutzneria albata]SDM72998.1 Methanogenic corrinoid protein MtbC1 [Allokutzneria albata]
MLTAEREKFFALLGDADEPGATRFVLGLFDNGVPPEHLLLDLVAPVQVKVGEYWATNRWSVAKEHAATHISECVVAALSTRTPVPPTRGHVVVSCMDGEWHALAARLVAEVLRLRGWRTTFLGASVPAAHLVSYLHQEGPDAVALSCALPVRLPHAHRMVETCQRTGVPVLVGGRGFGPDGRWARVLGAAGWAPGAREAADLLERRWPPPDLPHPELDHLVDDEYPTLVKRREELVDLALAALRREFPAMARYEERRLEATVEDLCHLADFLSAAVYVQDSVLFTDFLSWMCTVLAARHVPPTSLTIPLRTYWEALYDFPRARGHLEAGLRLVETGRAGLS